MASKYWSFALIPASPEGWGEPNIDIRLDITPPPVAWNIRIGENQKQAFEAKDNLFQGVVHGR